MFQTCTMCTLSPAGSPSAPGGAASALLTQLLAELVVSQLCASCPHLKPVNPLKLLGTGTPWSLTHPQGWSPVLPLCWQCWGGDFCPCNLLLCSPFLSLISHMILRISMIPGLLFYSSRVQLYSLWEKFKAITGTGHVKVWFSPRKWQWTRLLSWNWASLPGSFFVRGQRMMGMGWLRNQKALETLPGIK